MSVTGNLSNQGAAGISEGTIVAAVSSYSITVTAPTPPVALLTGVATEFSGTYEGTPEWIRAYWDAGFSELAGTAAFADGAWSVDVTATRTQLETPTLYFRAYDGSGYAFDNIAITVSLRALKDVLSTAIANWKVGLDTTVAAGRVANIGELTGRTPATYDLGLATTNGPMYIAEDEEIGLPIAYQGESELNALKTGSGANITSDATSYSWVLIGRTTPGETYQIILTDDANWNFGVNGSENLRWYWGGSSWLDENDRGAQFFVLCSRHNGTACSWDLYLSNGTTASGSGTVGPARAITTLRVMAMTGAYPWLGSFHELAFDSAQLSAGDWAAIKEYAVAELGFAPDSFTPPLAEHHPSIWIDSTALARMQAQRAVEDPNWAAFEAMIDTYLSQTVTAGYQGTGWCLHAISNALAYRVLLGVDNTKAAACATKALVYAQAMSRDGIQDGTVGDAEGGDASIQVDSGWPARSIGVGLAIALDWLDGYAGLTTEIRAEFIARLGTWCAWYSASGYQRNNVVSNYDAAYFFMQYTAALATWNTDLMLTAQLHWSAISKLYAGQLSGGDLPSSHWNYGPGIIKSFSGFVLAWRSAFGLDPLLELPWLADNVRYKARALQPGGLSVYVDGPWSGTTSGQVSFADCRYLARALDGTTPAAWIQEYQDVVATETVGYSGELWESALFYSSDDPAVDYRDTETTYYRAVGSGFVSGRSSWEDSAVWFGFRAGGHGLNLGPDDVGQGTISLSVAGVPVLVNATCWRGDGHTCFYQGYSGWCNAVDVVDSAKEFTDGMRGQEWNIAGHATVVHAHYEATDDYVYVDADLSGAYDTNENATVILPFYHRQAFYLAPGYVIVLDRITSRATTTITSQFWHFPGDPTVASRTATGSYPLTNPTGKLQLASLLPANVTLTKTLDVPETSSLYRVVITDADAQTSKIFLTVMRATAYSDGSPFWPTLVTAASTKMYGAVIGTNYVLFSAAADDTPVSGAISYTYSGSASKHYLVDLPPSTQYTLDSSGTTITLTPGSGALTSSAEGVLAFEVT